MASETRNFSTHPQNQPKVGLVLSGGGARGAYQAGVVKGIAEIANSIGIPHPMPIISGVSAGSINAGYLAAMCDDVGAAAERMCQMWSVLQAEDVFKADALSAGRSGLRFLTDATLGALYHRKLAHSLLDTRPLRKLLQTTIPFERIQQNIDKGCLHALAITAANYSTASSVTFVQGREGTPMWTRSQRTSMKTTIGADHIMASASIPLFFPPVAVENDAYGDGCLRNTAPLSPAIHLGADRLFVVSVRRPDDKAAPPTPNMEPSVARVIGVVLNALLLDAIDVDMERMSRVNQTVSLIPQTHRSELQLRKVEYLWIRPSRDIGHMAGDLFNRLPRVMRYLIGGLGSSAEAAELTSYLLFDPDFCGELVRMGYADALDARQSITEFLKGSNPA